MAILTMPFLRLLLGRRCPLSRKRWKGKTRKGKARDRQVDASEGTASLFSYGDCSDDEYVPDTRHHGSNDCSLAHNNVRTTHPKRKRAHTVQAISGGIMKSCRSKVYLHNESGQPYHRGPNCRATPNTPAWKRHYKIAHRLRTRFVDEVLGLPSAVTELISRPRTKKRDVPTLFYTNMEIKMFLGEWQKSGTMCTYATKMKVNGKMRTVGTF